MTSFDVFNGDADGICALVQLRRADPRPEAQLVTGVKRDIKLLDRVDAKRGDMVTVLDISMRSNAEGLAHVLNAGALVFYVDHHNAGDIPNHAGLDAVINTSPEICTALLVNGCLNGAFAEWAVMGAFGDNFPKQARKLAERLNCNEATLQQIERFGTLVNYNAYGSAVSDLHFAPDVLYRALAQFDSPRACLAEQPEIFQTLDAGYNDDMSAAKAGKTLSETATTRVIELPDAASSRRVSGVYGNALAQDNPERAHAILTRKSGGGYVVSVRAPIKNRVGADTLCLRFETGGGRAAAAGINHLPEADVDRFVAAFEDAYR